MNDLIAKLEAATEGSRELDEEISGFVGVREKCDYSVAYGHPKRWTFPSYTTSIDAALTLLNDLPHKYHWSLSFPVAQVELVASNRMIINTSAATPALAICIAAIKGRESTSVEKAA